MMDEDATLQVPQAQWQLQQALNNGERMDDEPERMDEDEGREGSYDERATARSDSSSPTVGAWHAITSFWGGGFQQQPQAGRSSPRNQGERVDMGDDCREEDMTMEREGGDPYDSRIHEPLKRGQEDGGQANKRRRLEDASIAFYQAVPGLSERQQAIMEYSAPSSVAPFFYFIGYTPFAITWGLVMYTLHFLQTAISTFGPETENFRWNAWIPPLVHHLMDTYVWNQSMITMMLLYPEWFGSTAYWVATLCITYSQCCYLCVSLKTHYIKHQHELKANCHQQIELRFLDCFLLYLLADLNFILARLLGYPILLYIGLVELNVAPLYIVWAYKKRFDAALKPVNQSNGQKDNINDNTNKKDDDTKKDR
ncbi:expressed unknown protein [Seminavis robusta]|uniref:Transmembrane protein n=1 Tax=Seminavis robusta TaxID=568900 RepID=A0A9N8HMW7_9STRA|nr:expressed unknown protein [Seminavis robusta]|eukprot:Sro777_g201030.1 n/a (368) ;mRNA; r:22356-23459